MERGRLFVLAGSVLLSVLLFSTLSFESKVESEEFIATVSNASAESITMLSPASQNVSWKQQPQGRKGKEHHLFAYVSNGCAGTTAVTRTINKLLRAHGEEPMWNGMEAMKELKNPFYSPTKGPYQMIVDFHEKAKELNKIWVAKLNRATLKNPLKVKALQELNPPVFISYRRNNFAELICNLRDCFRVEGGYPVHPSNGSKWDICFGRRQMAQATGQSSMVYVDVDVAVDQVRNSEQILKNKIAEWRKLVKSTLGRENVVAIASEDLCGYEMGQSGIQKSLRMSRKVLTAFGIEPQDELIMRVLRDISEVRKVENNRKKVYNYDEIKEALGKDF